MNKRGIFVNLINIYTEKEREGPVVKTSKIVKFWFFFFLFKYLTNPLPTITQGLLLLNK